jgi:hypothetical protein
MDLCRLSSCAYDAKSCSLGALLLQGAETYLMVGTSLFTAPWSAS